MLLYPAGCLAQPARAGNAPTQPGTRCSGTPGVLCFPLPGNFNGIVPKIAKIDCDQFRQAHTAIQEKDNNTAVPFIKSLCIFLTAVCFTGTQDIWAGISLGCQVDVIHWIFAQFIDLVAKVAKSRAGLSACRHRPWHRYHYCRRNQVIDNIPFVMVLIWRLVIWVKSISSGGVSGCARFQTIII